MLSLAAGAYDPAFEAVKTASSVWSFDCQHQPCGAAASDREFGPMVLLARTSSCSAAASDALHCIASWHLNLSAFHTTL